MTQRIPLKPLLALALINFLFPFVLFLAAGRLDWLFAWLFLIINIGFVIFSRFIVFRRNPDLLSERARSMRLEGAKKWDRLLVLVVGVFGALTTWIVAGLDHRHGWSPDLALPIQTISLVVLVFGYALGSWAMIVNPFFSSVVRIQLDRGQRVVKDGPYRIVRHPGYAGALVSYLAMPIMLDSLWALVPAGLTVIALIVRTALEDQTLKHELPGYAEYTQETNYRLIPSVW